MTHPRVSSVSLRFRRPAGGYIWILITQTPLHLRAQTPWQQDPGPPPHRRSLPGRGGREVLEYPEMWKDEAQRQQHTLVHTLQFRAVIDC